MQHQKHEQAKHYNKSVRDLPSLKTGNAVYIQLVPNTRKWIPGIVIERASAQSYRVKTIKGGIYIRNRKFIRIKHTDSRQGLQATGENRTPTYKNTHRKTQVKYKKTTKTNRVQELYQNMGHTKKICIKDSVYSLKCNSNGLCTYLYIY